MDWDKVIENLKQQSNWNIEQANKHAQMSGYEALTRQYRLKADIASMLSSAFHAGVIR
jgi:hypothetical protein